MERWIKLARVKIPDILMVQKHYNPLSCTHINIRQELKKFRNSIFVHLCVSTDVVGTILEKGAAVAFSLVIMVIRMMIMVMRMMIMVMRMMRMVMRIMSHNYKC